MFWKCSVKFIGRDRRGNVLSFLLDFMVQKYQNSFYLVLISFLDVVGVQKLEKLSWPYRHFKDIWLLYNNQIDARALIGQSVVGYFAGKPTEKSRVF